jgi:hypothetical protein
MNGPAFPLYCSPGAQLWFFEQALSQPRQYSNGNYVKYVFRIANEGNEAVDIGSEGGATSTQLAGNSTTLYIVDLSVNADRWGLVSGGSPTVRIQFVG